MQLAFPSPLIIMWFFFFSLPVFNDHPEAFLAAFILSSALLFLHWGFLLLCFALLPTTTYKHTCVVLCLAISWFVPPYLIYPLSFCPWPRIQSGRTILNGKFLKPSIGQMRQWQRQPAQEATIEDSRVYLSQFTIKRPVMHNVQVKYVGKISQFPRRKNTCSSLIYLILCK